jgi:hypothetical protein
MNQELCDAYDQYVQTVYIIARKYTIELKNQNKTIKEVKKIIDEIIEAEGVDPQLHRGVEEVVEEAYKTYKT